MVRIAQFRKYKNAPRGPASGRYKVPDWKKKLICSFGSMPRELAKTLALACNCSEGYIYQIRREYKRSFIVKHLV